MIAVHMGTERQTKQDVHFGELCRRATSDLLYPEGQELSLELSQLLRQVILGPVKYQISCELKLLVCRRTWTGARTP